MPIELYNPNTKPHSSIIQPDYFTGGNEIRTIQGPEEGIIAILRHHTNPLIHFFSTPDGAALGIDGSDPLKPGTRITFRDGRRVRVIPG